MTEESGLYARSHENRSLSVRVEYKSNRREQIPYGTLRFYFLNKRERKHQLEHNYSNSDSN